MSPRIPAPLDDVTLGDLVAGAAARVERQAGYAALAAKGGARAAALADWLHQARDCVVALARPRVLQQPLTAEATTDGVIIAGRVTVRDVSLRGDLEDGSELCATLCSLGYGQEEAFAALNRDYALHHIQTELARETLFALARAVDQAAQRRRPDWRLRRIPVKAEAMCGRHHLWEPAQVQTLLSLFGPEAADISLTDTGFFRPLHTLLGLSLMRRPSPDGANPGPQGSLS